MRMFPSTATRCCSRASRTQSDPWQIWELTLADRSLRRADCGRGRCDSARSICRQGGWFMRGARRTGFQLEAAGKDCAEAAGADRCARRRDGAAALAICRAMRFRPMCLLDGRILFEAGFPLGSGSTPELYLVYSDGSGVESYRCDHGRARWGGKQLASGDVVFTHGASLARFTSPLAHEAPIAAPHAEYAGAIAETADGAWLVSARNAARTRIMRCKLWKPGATALQTVLAVDGENLVEPVLVAPRTRPKRHPRGCIRLELRQHACARCAHVARGRFEDRAAHGAAGDRWTPTVTPW